jgi:hypothetical protein
MARKRTAAAGMHGRVGSGQLPESYRVLKQRAALQKIEIGSRGEVYRGLKVTFRTALKAEMDMLKHLGLEKDVEQKARENLAHHGITES